MDINYINRLKHCIDNNSLKEFVKIYNKNNIHVDCNGNTLLHYIVKQQCYDITSFLLKNHTNFETKNNEGLTAFDVSNDENKRIIFNYLLLREEEHIMKSDNNKHNMTNTIFEKNTIIEELNNEIKNLNDTIECQKNKYKTEIDNLNNTIENQKLTHIKEIENLNNDFEKIKNNYDKLLITCHNYRENVINTSDVLNNIEQQLNNIKKTKNF